MNGHNVTHRWKYGEDAAFEKTFAIGGNRWRIRTRKTLLPCDKQQSIEIVGENGEIYLHESVLID